MDVKKRLFRSLATAGLSAVALIAGCRRNEAALETALPQKDTPPLTTNSQPFVPEQQPSPVAVIPEKQAEPAAAIPQPPVAAPEMPRKPKTIYTPPIVSADSTWPLAGIARPYTEEPVKKIVPPVKHAQPEPKPIPVPVAPEPAPVQPPPEPTVYIKPEPEPPVAEEEIIEGPFFEIETPRPGTYYSDEITLTGTIGNSTALKNETDNVLSLYWAPENDPENIRYILFGEDGAFTSFIDASRFSDSLRLVFTAEDMQHNKSIRTVTLKDGRIPPQIKLTTPIQGDSYGPAFYIRGTVTDPYAADPSFGGIERIEYSLSSLLFQENEQNLTGSTVPEENGSFIFEVDSSTIKGVQQLEVRAVGKNGVSALAALTLNQGEAVINNFSVVPGDRSAEVSWLELPFAEKYTITWTPYTNGVPTGPSQSVTSLSSPARIDNLLNGLTYQLRVESEINQTPISSRTIQVLPLTAEALRPSLVPDYQRITVQWDPVPGAEGYDVLRSTDPGGENSEMLATGLSESSFIDYTTEFGTMYYYAVQPAGVVSITSLYSGAESLESPVQKLEVVNKSPLFTKGRLFSLGGYIYYADTDGGLNIIDVSLPGSLTPVGSIESEGAAGLTINKEYAFLAERDRGFKIINISDPRSPYEVNRTKTSDARDIAWLNDALYIADGDMGLKVFNVSDPLYPREAYRDSIPPTRKLQLQGENLFTITAEDLRIYSCTDPLKPQLLSILPVNDAVDVTLSEDRSTAYLIKDKTAMLIINIKDPVKPEVIANIDLPGALNVDVQRDFAFISLGNSGFQVIDVRDPASPYLFEQERGSSVTDLALNGTTLFTCGTEGLQRYSAYLYGNSYETDQLSLKNVVHKLILGNDRLEAIQKESGISAVPLIGSAFRDDDVISEYDGFASDLLRFNEYTLIASEEEGVKVFAAGEQSADPLFTLETEAPAINLAEAGKGVIAVLMQEYGIGLFRVADIDLKSALESKRIQSRPSSFIPLEDPRDILISGNTLFIADNNMGILTFDLTDTNSPELLFPYKVRRIKSLTRIGNLLAAGGADGIEILEIGEKSSLKKLYSLDIPMVEALDSDDSYIYVAQGVNGIKVIDPFAQRGPRVVSESPWIYSTDLVIDGSTAYSASGNIIRKVHIVVPPWLKSRE